MERENTAIRLKKIMDDRGLRQIDILNLTKPYCEKYDVKMNKSDLSQYCSGKTEPNQEKLFVLGKALNVSEAWLMGFDVPMNNECSSTEIISNKNELKIIEYYNQLNDIGKREATKRVEELTYLPQYKLQQCIPNHNILAAHAKENQTEEDIMSDINLIKSLKQEMDKNKTR